MKRHISPQDLLPEQMTAGVVVYIADYLSAGGRRKYNCTMRPRILDEYWLYYLTDLGIQEVDPVPITTERMKMLPDLSCVIGDTFAIDGTEFTVTPSGGWHVIMLSGQVVFSVRYIHQLQLAYSLITGASLNVSELYGSLKPYRCAARDTAMD